VINKEGKYMQISSFWQRAVYFFIIPFCFCLSKMHDLEAAITAYAQLSSLTSQVPPTKGIALIRMETIDALFNLSLSANKQSLVIKEDGFYFVVANAQVGSIDETTTGYVDIWLVVNNKSVPNSNSRMTVDVPTSSGLLVTQSILALKAGDHFGIGYSASGPSLGIVFSQPPNEPAIPSMIFTMIKM